MLATVPAYIVFIAVPASLISARRLVAILSLFEKSSTRSPNTRGVVYALMKIGHRQEVLIPGSLEYPMVRCCEDAFCRWLEETRVPPSVIEQF